MGRAHPGCHQRCEPELPDLMNGCQDPIKVEGFGHTAGLGMSTLDTIETMTPALVRSSQSGRAR